MAREKDITRRPKFFVRKRNVTDDMLCERCRHHRYVVMARYNCDALVITNTKLRGADFIEAAANGNYLHCWCTNEEEPPDCIQHFREVRAV